MTWNSDKNSFLNNRDRYLKEKVFQKKYINLYLISITIRNFSIQNSCIKAQLKSWKIFANEMFPGNILFHSFQYKKANLALAIKFTVTAPPHTLPAGNFSIQNIMHHEFFYMTIFRWKSKISFGNYMTDRPKKHEYNP